nr:molybdopterin-dependent oxidoreductase [Anaerolineaceae bacterium]
LRDADTILSIGLDTRFERSVVGVELNHNLKQGTRLVSIYPGAHNLSLHADINLNTSGERVKDVLQFFLQTLDGESVEHPFEDYLFKQNLSDAVDMLKESKKVKILVGPAYLQFSGTAEILEHIMMVARSINAEIITFPAQNNLFGILALGCLGEILPGGFGINQEKNMQSYNLLNGTNLIFSDKTWKVHDLDSETKLDVLYVIGESILDLKDLANTIIYQNFTAPQGNLQPYLVLASSAFSELDGTFFNAQGSTYHFQPAVDPLGESMPDWEILCRIARKLGVEGFEFSDSGQIHREMLQSISTSKNSKSHRIVDLNYDSDKLNINSYQKVSISEDFPFELQVSYCENTYRGFPLTNWVAGLNEILDEGILFMNRSEALEIGITEGEKTIIETDQGIHSWPVRLSEEQPEGWLYITLRQDEWQGACSTRAKIRVNNV